MDLGWEDPENGEDFFAMTDAEEAVIADADNKEEKSKNKNSKESEEDTKEDGEDFFKEFDKDVKEEEIESSVEEPKNIEEKVVVFDNISTLNYLKEKGLVSFELDDEEELTDERAAELLEDSYEAALDEKIADKLNNLPTDVQTLIKFTLKGGSIQDFLNQMDDTGLPEDLDLDEEKNQEKALRMILASEGDDEEDIDEKIEYLKDKGTLAKAAQKKYQKYIAEKKEEEQSILKEQQEQREAAKQAERASKLAMNNFLVENKDLNGLPISKKNKESLAEFTYGKTVPMSNGTYITPMQKELFYEVAKNTVANAQLAILLQNRNEDGTFNFDAIIKKSESNVTKNIKENIQRSGKSKEKLTGRVEKPQIPLSDLFK